MSEQLLPCPFCGGEAFEDIWENKFGVFEGSIACDCGVKGPDIDTDGPTNEEAIEVATEAWNTRTIPEVGEVVKVGGFQFPIKIESIDEGTPLADHALVDACGDLIIPNVSEESVIWDFVEQVNSTIQSQQAQIERLEKERNQFKEQSDLTLEALSREEQLQARNKELEVLVQKSFWEGFEDSFILDGRNIQKAWERSTAKQALSQPDQRREELDLKASEANEGSAETGTDGLSAAQDVTKERQRQQDREGI